MRRTSHYILLILISALLAGCFSNRNSGTRFKRRETSTNITVSRAPKGGNIAVAGSGRYPQDWTFLGYETLKWVIQRELKITGSNRNPAAEQAVLAQLESHKMDLGGNNFAMGVTPNLRPEPTKFRFLLELINESCALGTQEPAVRERLFSVSSANMHWNSENSFDSIFTRFLGRAPQATEKNILRRLADDLKAMGTDLVGQQAAVCTVVLGSVEFHHGH